MLDSGMNGKDMVVIFIGQRQTVWQITFAKLDMDEAGIPACRLSGRDEGCWREGHMTGQCLQMTG